MAKLSQKQLNYYDELLKKKRQVEKKLVRYRKKQEQKGGRLPPLILPDSPEGTSKRVNWRALKRRMGAERFRKMLSEWNKLYGEGINSYLRETLKRGYMELWRDLISRLSEGIEPKGRFFTKEQMDAVSSDIARYMKTYNRLQWLSPSMFHYLHHKGMIIGFKEIYNEAMSLTGLQFNYLEEQNEMLDISKIVRSKEDIAHFMTKREFNSLMRKEHPEWYMSYEDKQGSVHHTLRKSRKVREAYEKEKSKVDIDEID